MTDPAHPSRRSVSCASRRIAAATVIAVTATLAAAVVGPTTASAQREPVTATRTTVSPADAAENDLGGDLPPGHARGAIIAPQEVPRGLAVVGATWAPGEVGADDVVEIRVRRDGAWQGWEAMETDDDHAPDRDGPGAEEAVEARPGTAPYVAEGEQTQVRVVTSGNRTPEIKVDVIDPGTSPADETAGVPAAGSASAAATRPTIIPRKDWGADESIRKGSPTYGQAQVAFVHHTAGSNSYSSAQVPGILRGIYDFHVNGRGWNDIGYQFLIDRYGRTWEGREGGVDRAVIGAQAGGFNSGSFGVSVMGDFTSSTPPAAVLTALEKLIAWKLTLHGTPAKGTTTVNGEPFQRISGHRDANSTSCPGPRLYATIPAVRAGVAARMGTPPKDKLVRSVDKGSTTDVLAYRGTSAPASATATPEVWRLSVPAPVESAVRVGAGWNALADATLTPDVTGDGRADLIARDPRTSGLVLYVGNGRGGASSARSFGSGWNAMRWIVAAGDRNGDGANDLVAVTTKGRALWYRGDGSGGFRPGVVLADDWRDYRSLTAVGDLSGDGRPDLLGIRTSDQALVLLPTAADGTVSMPRVLSRGWSSVADLIGSGDLDRDGHLGDLIARQGDGRMRTYYSDQSRSLSRANVWGGGWSVLTQLTSGADWDGDGRNDLLAVLPTEEAGALVTYRGTSVRDFALPPVTTGLDVSQVDLVRLVGDVDGDGFGDVVMRRAGGDLAAARGRGDGSFDPPFVIGRGWDLADLIEPAGDFTRDGVPDILVRMRSGESRLYSLSKSFSFTWQVSLASDWRSIRDAAGVGAMNSDPSGDLVTLRASDGALLLWRGSGPGGLTDYVVLRTGQNDLRSIAGGGDVNGDGHNDILAKDAAGTLWLYAGDGRGRLAYGRQPMRSPGSLEVMG